MRCLIPLNRCWLKLMTIKTHKICFFVFFLGGGFCFLTDASFFDSFFFLRLHYRLSPCTIGTKRERTTDSGRLILGFTGNLSSLVTPVTTYMAIGCYHDKTRSRIQDQIYFFTLPTGRDIERFQHVFLLAAGIFLIAYLFTYLYHSLTMLKW